MNKKSKAMQEAHCHACQMTGFKQERERDRMVLDVPRIDVEERNAARRCSAFEQSVCKSSKFVCVCVCVGIEPAESIYSFLK